ncbi:MAG TPA: FtsX-like permease family protein [Gemmatimonadales bacterium]
MPSPRWRKVLRDVWHHKARTLLVVLAIAIGIVGAGAVLNTWSLLRRVTSEGYLATNPASATLRTDSIDTALLEQVRAMPGIEAAEARRTVVGAAMTQGSWRTAILFAADDFSAARIGRIAAESGQWPPAEGMLTIERSSLEFSGAGLGDAVPVRVGDGPETPLRVSGVARDAGLAPGWMEHVVYGFISPATLARLGLPATLNQLLITVADRSQDRESVRTTAYRVKVLVESTGRTVSDVDVPEPGEHVHAAQINSLLYTQGAFGVLALLLSGFLVINLMAAMLTGQVREIGVMKTLGARPGQLAGMYLVLAFVLGLVACLIALPVAARLGHWYADFSASLLNFDTTGFRIPLWSLAVQLAVGTLLPVAAAAVPVIRGCRVPVSEALRDFGITGQGGAPGRILSRVGGPSRPLLLSLRNAFRRRQRMALTLVTLALGGAVYLGALNLRASIRNSVGYLFDDLLRYDMSIQLAAPHAADSLEAAALAVEGVEGAEAWVGKRAAVLRSDGVLGNAFPVGGIPSGSKMVAFPLDSGRWLGAGGANELVVNRRLLQDEPGLRLGGTVTLMLGGRPTQWTVVGVVASMPSASAFATREALGQAVADLRAGQLVVTAARSGEDAESQLIRRVREELAGAGFDVASAQLMAESRRVMEDHLLMVAGFLLLMSQAMIVVGGLGLASTMSLSVLERTREIGVLRAIGARHRAILAMVQIEGLVIALASWALAIPMSIPMSVVLGKAFGRIMLPVRIESLVPEPSGVGLWLVVVVVVSLVACAGPGIRATRITTAAALSYE